MERAERPEDAAIREIGEETGLKVDRLYNVICQPFYLHKAGVVQMAVVFAALVAGRPAPVLGEEHDAAEWLPWDDALARIAWPRSRRALNEIREMLWGGDAGPVEDVMRVR